MIYGQTRQLRVREVEYAIASEQSQPVWNCESLDKNKNKSYTSSNQPG